MNLIQKIKNLFSRKIDEVYVWKVLRKEGNTFILRKNFPEDRLKWLDETVKNMVQDFRNLWEASETKDDETREKIMQKIKPIRK